jgi:cytochrome oxidase Cu insertion factor (SCO1/SenC/PrrC family)
MSSLSEFDRAPDEPHRLNRRAIPDVAVTDHEGRVSRFYRDLVRDRIVLIAFMSIAHERHYPVTPKLAEVRALLDRGPGAMTQIYAITVDPENDTQRRLAAQASRSGAGPGLLLLRAGREETEALRGALFVRRGAGADPGERRLYRRADLLRISPERAVMDCSLGLLRYGNERLDIWGGVPARAAARDIAQRIDWINDALCRASDSQPRRRAGPRPLLTV